MSNLDKQVHVDSVDPFINEYGDGLVIRWYGDPGFGEYTIYRSKEDGKWRADSEYMDAKDDHWLIDLLLKDFIENHIEEMR